MSEETEVQMLTCPKLHDSNIKNNNCGCRAAQRLRPALLKQEAWGQSLVGNLRSHMPHGMV